MKFYFQKYAHAVLGFFKRFPSFFKAFWAFCKRIPELCKALWISRKQFPAKCKAFWEACKQLPQKIKSLNRKKLKRYLLPGLMLLFACIFLFSAGYLIKMALDDRKQSKQNQYLADIVQQVQQDTPIQRPPISPNGPSQKYEEPLSAFTEIPHPETGEPVKVLREYAPVYQLNSDMVGWISLPGSKLNYPVVQTPDDPDYYLKRDFYKESARHGTVYAHAWADINYPSDNVTLYGHNMRDGSMFAPLHQYENEEFYKANPYIYFDTLYEHRTYQVLAVFEIDITKVDFPYHNFVKGNSISFRDYISNCRAHAFYPTGVTATYGDKLLTLSTCDMDTSTDDIRFVVVAKLVS